MRWNDTTGVRVNFHMYLHFINTLVLQVKITPLDAFCMDSMLTVVQFDNADSSSQNT